MSSIYDFMPKKIAEIFDAVNRHITKVLPKTFAAGDLVTYRDQDKTYVIISTPEHSYFRTEAGWVSIYTYKDQDSNMRYSRRKHEFENGMFSKVKV